MNFTDTVLNNPALFRAYSRKAKLVQHVSLDLCDYDKERKVLKLTSDHIGKPSEFYVKSHHTQKRVLFKPVQPGDVLYDEDHWDGEQQIYRPVEKLPNVDYMVIYNQF